MNLSYVKISKTLYKFFYEQNGKYGEFYMNITPARDGAAVGNATLERKDPAYAVALLDGLQEELDPVDTDKIQGINMSLEGIN